MTREEAKEAIKEAYGNSEYTYEIIKALEQEIGSSEKPNKSEIPTGSDDCISRQDVLPEIIRFSTEDKFKEIEQSLLEKY